MIHLLTNNIFFGLWALFLNVIGSHLLQADRYTYRQKMLTPLGILIFNFSPTPWQFLFFSLLFITIRTDMETALISRATTLYPVPLFLAVAYYNQLSISFFESLFGIIVGYGFMYIVRWIFFQIKKQEGMGLGDVELMALIGSFTGPLGVWFTVLIGSISGIIFMLGKQIITKKESKYVPFGPFLALAAILYTIFEPYIIQAHSLYCM